MYNNVKERTVVAHLLPATRQHSSLGSFVLAGLAGWCGCERAVALILRRKRRCGAPGWGRLALVACRKVGLRG